MLYGRLIDRLINRLNIENNSNNRLNSGVRINFAHRELGNISTVDWPNLTRLWPLRTIPNVTTGTVSVTAFNGTNHQTARTASFSFSIITSDMVGRYLQVNGTPDWYRIVRMVSGTEVRLDPEYIGESVGAGTFNIWKRFYYFPSEARRIKFGDTWLREGEMEEVDINRMRELSPNLSDIGDPLRFAIYGEDQVQLTYNTGTVTIIKDGNVVTGSNDTRWFANASPGDLFIIGDNEFRIKEIEDDDRIILVQHDPNGTASGKYEIRKDHTLGVQFEKTPNAEIVLPFSYQKRVYDMIDESMDRPQLPEEVDQAILDGAEMSGERKLSGQDWVNLINLYGSRIKDLRRTYLPSTPRRRVARVNILNDRGQYLR